MSERRALSSSSWVGRAAGQERRDLVADVLDRLGEPVALDGRPDRERPGGPPALELAADAVGESPLLAELLVEPGRELPAEDLVEEQQVVEGGVEPSDPAMAGPDHGLRGAGPVEQQDAGTRRERRRPAIRGSVMSGPRQPASRRSSSSATGSGVHVAGDDDRRPGRAPGTRRGTPSGRPPSMARTRLLGPAQGESVGMSRSVEGLEQGPIGAGLGAVPLGPEGGEGLAVHPPPFHLGEGGVEQDVGGQVQGRPRGRPSGTGIRRRCRPIRNRRDRGPHGLGGHRDLRGGPVRRCPRRACRR